MDNYQIARQAGGLVWHYKFLWVLGFLASVVQFVNQALGEDGTASSGAGGAGAAAAESGPLTTGELALAILVLGNIVGLFILLWLISVVANSALLYSVAELDAGRPAGLWSALKAGIRFVPRMMAASILLYLPVLLLTGAAFVIALVAEMQSPGGADALFLPFLCVVLLYLLLAWPILSFTHRAIVMERKGIFAAIRLGKDVFLKKIAPTYGLVFLVIAYGIPAGLVVFGAQAVHPLVGLVVIAIVVAFMAAFQSAAFTLAFREWVGLRAEVLPDEGQLALA